MQSEENERKQGLSLAVVFLSQWERMENSTHYLEEKLREYCCIGDEEKVKILVDRGVNLNSAHKVNGWTALHWAAKRNHKNIVKYLMNEGNADAGIQTSKGELAAELTTDQEIRTFLGGERGSTVVTASQVPLPIVPNYMKNPDFFYSDSDDDSRFGLQLKTKEVEKNRAGQSRSSHDSTFNAVADNYSNTGVGPLNPWPCKTFHCCFCDHISSATTRFRKSDDDLIVKLRAANIGDDDFIEFELERTKITFLDFFQTCCKELGVECEKVKKVRKLPNTILRNDKDVLRLQQFQEIELVLEHDYDVSKLTVSYISKQQEQ